MSKAKFTDIESIGVKEVFENEKRRRKEIAEATLISENVERGIKQMRKKNGAIMLVKMTDEERLEKQRKQYEESGDVKCKCVSPIMNKPEMRYYGYAVKCEGDFTKENIDKAKEIVLDKICEIIRDVARAVPNDFFIIKNKETLKKEYERLPDFLRPSDEEIDAINYFSVGCKIELPSAYTEEE